MIANVIELKVVVHVFRRRLDLERNIFDPDVPSLRSRALTFLIEGKCAFETELPTEFLDKILPDVSDLGVGDALDALKRRIDPLVGVGILGQHAAQYPAGISHPRTRHPSGLDGYGTC